MANEMKIARSVAITGGGVTIGGVSEQIACDSLSPFSKTIPASSTNAQLAQPDVTLSTCKVMAIIASKACVVKTNSTSSPGDTINLVANKPLHWLSGDPDANKFLTVDVTAWYVTTTADNEPLLKILIGHDATPGLGD